MTRSEMNEAGWNEAKPPTAFDKLLTTFTIAVERETENPDDPELPLVTLAAQKAVVAHVADLERKLALLAAKDAGVNR